MSEALSRREFLKLLSLLPPAYYLPAERTQKNNAGGTQPNILILVFDAWSANHISLLDYPRETTPNLHALAEKAIVYHKHFAGGHFTYPGTATLLTGVHPWTHRGYTAGTQIIAPYHKDNLLGMFDSHNRITYTHNSVADALLRRIIGVTDTYKPRQELYLNDDFWLAKVFAQDYDIASVSWVRVAKMLDDGYANSLFLSRLYEFFQSREINDLLEEYPLGLPAVEGDNYFLLETAIDWVHAQATTLSQPYLGYFHMLPPHDPYAPRREWVSAFADDGYNPVVKPEHVFTTDTPQERLNYRCREYDEYIAFVDAEIQRLFTMLEESNALENTWVVLTSDHGEMFERGIIGHVEPTFHRPLMHVPLMIFPPGQQERVDVTVPTSAVDVVPTLLHIAGKQIPAHLEGTLLPPFNTTPDPERAIYAMDARFSAQLGPFTSGTVMLRKGRYKFTYYFGNEGKYEKLNGKPLYELYDLETDPEELENLFETHPELGQAMLDEIIEKLREKDVLA